MCFNPLYCGETSVLRGSRKEGDMPEILSKKL